MGKIRKMFINSLVGILATVALFEVGTTSMFLYYQPSVPEELKRK